MAMWGRKEPEDQKVPPAPGPTQTQQSAPHPTPSRPVESTPVAAPAAAAPARGVQPMEQQQPQRKAVLGPSIHVKGELIGNEDLILEGKIEGVVRLRDNHLTVGKSADVKATLEAKAIRIEGTVNGDVLATDRIELASGSTLVGDIVAPRIIISDGARFKGSVDMDHARGGSSSHGSSVSHAPSAPQRSQGAPMGEPVGAGKTNP